MTTVTEQADTARADLPPGKIVVVMPGLQRGARRSSGPTPPSRPGWVDEVILVDDKSPDDTIEVARSCRCRSSGTRTTSATAATRRRATWRRCSSDADVVVMLHPDGQYEPTLIPKLVAPHPARRGRPRARLAPRRRPARRAQGGMPLWKLIANRCLTGGREPGPGHPPDRDAHRLPRVLAASCCSGAVPAQLARLLVRLRDAACRPSHFGLPDRRRCPARTIYFDDASSVALGPAIVYGCKTLLARRAADAAPVGDPAVAQVGVRTPRREPVTGERVTTPRGRLQPDLAAPRRRLRAAREVLPRRARCSTWAAAPGTRCRAARAARDGRRGHRSATRSSGQGAATRGGRHARAAVPGRELRLGASRSSRSSTCPTPTGRSPRSCACSQPGGAAVIRRPPTG